MRTLGVLVICLALLPQAVEAKQKRSSPVAAVAVEKVVKAGPDADGKTFRLELQLKNGSQAAYQFTPASADEVSKGFTTKPAIVVKGKKVEYLDVRSIQIEVDRQHQLVILMPRAKEQALDSLGFSLMAADTLVKALQAAFNRLQPEAADTQQKQFSAVKAVAVEKVAKADQQADGTAFRLELRLKNGRQVAYQFTPPEADEVSDGLSKTVVKVLDEKMEYFRVRSMQIAVDPQRQRVILIPVTAGHKLDSLGLSLTAVKDNLIESLQEDFALLRADVAKEGSQQNQPAQQQPAQQK